MFRCVREKRREEEGRGEKREKEGEESEGGQSRSAKKKDFVAHEFFYFRPWTQANALFPRLMSLLCDLA